MSSLPPIYFLPTHAPTYNACPTCYLPNLLPTTCSHPIHVLPPSYLCPTYPLHVSRLGITYQPHALLLGSSHRRPKKPLLISNAHPAYILLTSYMP